MRVVWLCHLHNKDISNQLGVKETIEFAPWISRFADLFMKRDDIEIHIVSPHGSISSKREYKQGSIKYHFFPYKFPIVPNRIIKFLHVVSNYYILKIFVRKIIAKINPDIIHLFGPENAYYSSAIFQFINHYQILVTIQGFAYKIINKNYDVRKRISVENKIIREVMNFGVRNKEMKNDILKINPNARFFDHEIAPYKPKFKSHKNVKKKFDIVFFARVCKDKGIEDLLEAIKKVKEVYDDVSLCIIGHASKEYYNFLLKQIDSFDLISNVKYLGELNSLDEVHDVAVKSKMTVLPTKYDTIPGTILESMYMGIPCISYSVGGLPSLNDEEETIILINEGNINELAEKIILLLNNPEYGFELAERARKYIEHRWNEDKLKSTLHAIYSKIINNKEVYNAV